MTLLCLYGPTAVGKTAALCALRSLPIEVISADSMQIYRGLDIGTAKPDAGLLAVIPHHLIDIVTPDTSFDVAQFVSQATALASDIRSRGRLPLVVGGTGYYIRHLIYGLPGAPPADPEIRNALQRELDEHGLPALREQLHACDPITAERTARTDAYRTLRALEVYRQTGRPLSSFKRPGAGAAGGAGEGRRSVPAPVVELWRPRAELTARISDRVRQMIRRGLRGEVEGLVAAGATARWPGMRAIGYREFFGEDGGVRPSADTPTISDEITTATRRYAKRQQTFANQFPHRVHLHADAVGTLAALVRSRARDLDTV